MCVCLDFPNNTYAYYSQTPSCAAGSSGFSVCLCVYVVCVGVLSLDGCCDELAGSQSVLMIWSCYGFVWVRTLYKLVAV